MKIGIDLGGTNMRVGLTDGATLVNSVIEPCPSKEAEEVVINQLKRQIAQLMSEDVTSIGVGVPSVVDCQQGIVYNVANIPSWKEVHLKEILEKEFGVPVAVNNDANCFALGVWKYGEGKGTRDMVGLTMGTGIGSGIIIDGKLYNGVNTGAGEIGSLPFKDADYEFYCSSRFFSDLHGDTGANFGKRAQAGDAEAVAVWNEFGENVGELIKAVLFTYAPEAIIIGGGIASAFPLFEAPMRASLKSFPYPANVAATRIMPSTLPNAAILGAGALNDNLK
ncbi:MAG: ROK family protein [Prevotella sp.]|nr:ROK family protein [Prevotella sp.]